MSFYIKFTRTPVDMVVSLTLSLVNLICKLVHSHGQTNDYEEHVIIDFRVDLTSSMTSIKECNVMLT